jgi:hypothetical protein
MRTTPTTKSRFENPAPIGHAETPDHHRPALLLRTRENSVICWQNTRTPRAWQAEALRQTIDYISEAVAPA